MINTQRNLRIRFLLMAHLKASGDVGIRLQEGRTTCLDPFRHPRDPDNYVALASAPITREIENALDALAEALSDAARIGATGHVYVRVVEGVPQLPVEEAFLVLLEGAEPRQKPRQEPMLRRVK